MHQAESQSAALSSVERRLPTGFTRGTLIHTPGGPVPIELLRVGYMVFSRSTDPGRHAEPSMATRITAVRVHEHAPVMRIDYERPEDAWLSNHVTMAPGQPLFTLDKGWIRADELLADWEVPSKLITVSGATVHCVGKTCIRATDYKDMGWIQLDAIDGEGLLWDYRLDMLIEGGRMYDGLAWGGERYAKCGLPDDFRTTTYSIEVEDHHTLFAGFHGLLAGDSSRVGEIAGEQEQHSALP